MTRVVLNSEAIGSLEAARLWDWHHKPMSIVVRYDQAAEWDSARHYFGRAEANREPVYFDMGRPDVGEIASRIRQASMGNWDAKLVSGDVQHAHTIAAIPDVIPTFWLGESWHMLAGYAKASTTIALDGYAGLPKKLVEKWIGQVFARVWPRRIYARNLHDVEIAKAFPFAIVDATTAALDRFGIVSRSNTMRSHAVRAYMDEAWNLEATLRAQWSKEIAKCPE